MTDNESLESNNNNECHILFVSFIVIVYCFYFLILCLKCLPNKSSFSTGSSYPPSTHVKAIKPVMKSAVKSTKGAKEREKKQGSASGSGGKGNQKEVESDQADIKKRSHKKKTGAASG